MRLLIPLVMALLFAPGRSSGAADAAARPASAPAVSGEQLDKALRDVLAQPEFSWRMPREQVQTERRPGVLSGFLDHLARWAGRAATHLLRLIERIGRWLERLFHQQDRAESKPPDWQTPVQTLLFALLGVTASILGVLLYRLWKRRREAPAVAATPLESAAPDLRDEGLKADSLPSDEWVRLAEEFVARGELRLALRALFLACLSVLAQHERIRVAAFKSNGEYRRELDRRAHERPALLAAFEQNVRLLEAGWYGRHEVTPAEIEAFDANREAIAREAPAGREAARAGGGVVGWLLALAAALLFALGVVRLFHLRFAAGDIYPAYSSLRTDPLGARILYEGLASCEGMRVTRSFRPEEQAGIPPDSTLLILGASFLDARLLSRSTAAFITTYVRHGGRLVVTLMPRNWTPSTRPRTPEKADARKPKEKKPDGRKGKDSEDEEGREGQDYVDVRGLWGVGFDDVALGEDSVALRSPSAAGLRLPRQLSCHTSLVLTNSAPDWTPVYERAGKAVMLERRMGKGTIVLSAESYFVSNEAMRDERHARLLAWLAGPHRAVVFDEYRHGIEEQSGVAVLARRYGLQGLGTGLLALALLFVWQNATSLVPASPSGASRPVARGKDSMAGLVNLLRRNVPAGALLDACVEEWRKADRRQAPGDEERLRRMKEMAARTASGGTRRGDVARLYNEIGAIALAGRPAARRSGDAHQAQSERTV